MADQGTLTPLPFWQVFDDNGDPLAGALLYTYESGTSTPATVYSDPDLDPIHALTNPVVADSAGYFVPIYLAPAAYKFVLKTSAGVTRQTIDPVPSVPANAENVVISGVAGETLTQGTCVYLSDGSGSKTPGYWYKADADFTYASSEAIAIGFALADITASATGSIEIAGQVTGLSGLTPGLTYYVSSTAGEITSTAPSPARVVGVSDTTTSLIMNMTGGGGLDIIQIAAFLG